MAKKIEENFKLSSISGLSSEHFFFLFLMLFVSLL